MRVYLSPSGQVHNQYYDKKHTESEICRKIAGRVKYYLEKESVSVMLAPQYNNDAEWMARVTASDNFKADYHVCIHTNAGGGHGVRILCNPSRTGEEIMKRCRDEIERILPGGHKTAKIVGTSNLYEINVPRAKTIYYEVAFHDCSVEAEWLVNNIDVIAVAIVKGITNITFAKEEANDVLYRVQLGAYRNRENADKMLATLKAKGFDGFIKVEVK